MWFLRRKFVRNFVVYGSSVGVFRTLAACDSVGDSSHPGVDRRSSDPPLGNPSGSGSGADGSVPAGDGSLSNLFPQDGGNAPYDGGPPRPGYDAGPPPPGYDAGPPDNNNFDAGVVQNNCGQIDNNIRNNHGHALFVSAADVEDGNDKTYNIQGNSGHPHTVTVTAADFRALADGENVVLTSSQDNGHTHGVALRCA